MLNERSNYQLSQLSWIILWTALLISFCIFLPGFSESDTSKYITITKDMMSRHDYLLPFWHGHLYSDKPPLLFWLFIAGWHFFGVVNWWPQCIILALATCSILVSRKLAFALWPDNKTIAQLTPIIMVGCFYWVWFAKQIRVDGILVLATLLSFYCIIKSIQGKRIYWFWYILSIGLGGLAKGPVILVFILLPAFFLPAMIQQNKNVSPKWFALLALATIAGMCIPLAWAIPAAIRGGDAFTQQIFYNQISHRASMSRDPMSFYLFHLPLWLLPWSIYPPVWKGLRTLKLFRWPSSDSACMAIIVCGFIVFSVFGQKLPHYIYPLFPIFALLIARMCAIDQPYRQHHQWPIGVLIFLLAIFCMLFPYIAHQLPQQAYVRTYFLAEVNLAAWGSALFIAALLLLLYNSRSQIIQITLIAASTVLVALFVNNAVLSTYEKHMTNQSVMAALQQAANRHQPIVIDGTIKDQEIMQFIKHHHLASTQTTKNNLILSSKVNQGNQQKLLAWYYPSRFSIIKLSVNS